MRFLRLFVLVGAGWVFAMPASALTLTLKSSVTSSRAYVTLDEVAEISDLAHPNLLSELQRLRVATAPKLGQGIHLTREQLLKTLRFQSPALVSNVKWMGSEAVLVSRAEQELDRSPLRQVAEAALRKALLSKVIAPEIKALDTLSIPPAPPGPLTVTVVSIKPEAPAQRMSVELEVRVGDHFRRTFPVWFAVQGKINVFAAKNNIAAGTAFDTKLFETTQVDLGESHTPFGTDPTAAKFRLRRGIERGAVLSTADIELAPPVTHQQQIAVQVIADGITLETSGIALSDGDIGSPIRIKNPRSGEIFSALVSAPGIATISVR